MSNNSPRRADNDEGNVAPVYEDAACFAGQADGLGRLWTPHRAAYISGENRPVKNTDQDTNAPCPFCEAPKRTDEDSLILARGHNCFAILNLYPYNSGHLLVCTYRHVSLYTDLTYSERVEMAEMTATAMRVLNRAMGPGGFNLGMNQEEVGGAGIAAHIHQHVVPRWLGDANFLPIIARTKTIPAILADTRNLLAQEWEKENTGDWLGFTPDESRPVS